MLHLPEGGSLNPSVHLTGREFLVVRVKVFTRDAYFLFVVTLSDSAHVPVKTAEVVLFADTDFRT